MDNIFLGIVAVGVAALLYLSNRSINRKIADDIRKDARRRFLEGTYGDGDN